MKESTRAFHNDVLENYRTLMFETLVFPTNITSESVKVFTFENENGEQLEALRGYLASKEIKGKIQKYFFEEYYQIEENGKMVTKHLFDVLPLRVLSGEDVYLKESSTKK